MADLALVRTANGLVGATEADRELIRFNKKFRVDPFSGCWVWIASKLPAGYGRFRPNGKGMDLAHRFSFEFFKGAIPEGLTIDHKCRNRSCCNPEHLEAVTQLINNLRSKPFFKKKSSETHCANGHPWEGNRRPTSRGFSICRTCANKSEQRRRDRAKEKGSGI